MLDLTMKIWFLFNAKVTYPTGSYIPTIFHVSVVTMQMIAIKIFPISQIIAAHFTNEF